MFILGANMNTATMKLIVISYSRIHFDYTLCGLFLAYLVGFILGFGSLRYGMWLLLWIWVTAADIVCFLTGFFASWGDVGAISLP
jgi:hypothetical protein